MAEYVLSIGEARTELYADAPGATPMLLPGVGWHAIAHGYFKQHPPSALELENAIAAIEDGIARARHVPAQGARVLTQDARVREIAIAAGLPPDAETTLTLPAVEQAFQRLAAQASRGLRSADGVPAGNEAAAALVILRELMHHVGLASVIVRS